MEEREIRERIEGGYPITAEDAKVFVSLLDAERKRVAKWQTLFYESEEENCSCNIVDTSKPVGDPYNYICDWHQRHPHIAVAREEVITLSERVEELEGALKMAWSQLKYIEKMGCPCGARGEDLEGWPHVGGCGVARLLELAESLLNKEQK